MMNVSKSKGKVFPPNQQIEKPVLIFIHHK